MNEENDNKEYIQIGTISKEQLSPNEEEMNKISLTSEPMQPGRDDKKVIVSSPGKSPKRVSNIFIGKGIKGQPITLADGTYANAEEIRKAILEEVNKVQAEYEKPILIVNSKGEYFDVEKLINVVIELGGKVTLSEGSEKINQQNYYQQIQPSHSNTQISKGLSFGYGKLQLPAGDYISVEELQKALEDYLILIEDRSNINPKPFPEPNQKKESQNYVVRVTQKHKNNLSKTIVALGIAATLLSGFSKDIKNDKTVEIKPTQVTIEAEDVSYNIDSYKTIVEQEQIVTGEVSCNLNMGDIITVPTGLTVYETSLLTGNAKTFGGPELNMENKVPGKYKVTGFSITYGGRIIDYIETFNEENVQKNLGDFINETCKKNNLNPSEVKILVHIGSNLDKTRAGWFDITELMKVEEITKEVVNEIVKKDTSYSGTIANFDDDFITISTSNGQVRIPIKDSNGNYLKSGVNVIGSDGKQYQISSLEVIKNESLKDVPSTNMYETNQDVEVGVKIKYNIEDCQLSILATGILTSLAYAMKKKKENKKFEDNPYFDSFSTEEEYNQFKREFEEAKKKYEEKSTFKQKLIHILYGKKIDIMKNLTEEQIKQIYNEVINCHTSDYSYSPSDKIRIKNGKIIITTKDGYVQDITEIIMPKIKLIGS